MSNTFKLVVLFFFTVACDPINNSNLNKKLSYTKDSRTGLCFATHCLTCQGAIMTNVPCTPQVENLITSQK